MQSANLLQILQFCYNCAQLQFFFKFWPQKITALFTNTLLFYFLLFLFLVFLVSLLRVLCIKSVTIIIAVVVINCMQLPVIYHQDAGNAVKRATEALVTEAQKVRGWSSYTQDDSSVTVDERMVGSMAQV